ncbi:CLUMA_CG018647, isoform A [Clunio marinus]|uniref:CLUMA_CG018647, isoform A n=1 Tax=Clunio marinus TaxID=568069 RepID=A0A1J1IY68_9DIPT|nr:CLUMA_CG018647, isoform A [Clunio marinus]
MRVNLWNLTRVVKFLNSPHMSRMKVKTLNFDLNRLEPQRLNFEKEPEAVKYFNELLSTSNK